MGWQGETYYYSVKILRVIAENYTSIYDGLELRPGHLITNPWALAEFRADFDVALQSIGKGKWTGNIDGRKFKDYHYYGRLQRIVIADIFGVTDSELEGLGFYSIPRLRGYAYYLMVCSLNGIDKGNGRHYNENGGEQ